MHFFKKAIKGISSKNYTLILAALAIALLGFFFGERMANFGMLGDEKRYGIMTANFYELLFNHRIDDYLLQRILPPALVHHTIKFLNLSFTSENMINVYGTYNIILSGVIAYVWCLIAKELQISNRGRWLGFLAIFCNYQMMKFIPFTQVTTDLFAYAATLALVYFYIRNNLPALFFLTLLGAFVWPTIIYMGAALMLFPRDNQPEENADPVPFRLNLIFPLLLIVPAIYYFNFILKGIHSGRLFAYGVFSMGSNKPLMPVIYLSIAVTLIYLFVAISTLLKNGKFFRRGYWLSKFNIKGVTLSLLVVLAVKIIIHYMAGSHNARPTDYLITNLLIVSIMQPGAFFVSHVLYFGPALVFLLFLWKPFCRLVQNYGAGLVICMLLVIVFSLDSESRKQMATYPLLLPFLIKVTDSMGWRKSAYWFIAIASILFSKVWLRIPSWPLGISAQEFPAQYYYMTMGSWMSHSMYALQGAAVLVLIFGVYFFMFREKKRAGQCLT